MWPPGSSRARRSRTSASDPHPRERQILSLVTDGLAGKQVARVLGISPKTVERHKTRIYSKLGVPNQAAAAGLAARAYRDRKRSSGTG